MYLCEYVYAYVYMHECMYVYPNKHAGLAGTPKIAFLQ